MCDFTQEEISGMLIQDFTAMMLLKGTKSNALTNKAFASFIRERSITEFYVVGADATACIKSTCFNMAKAGYTVHVLSDCITSYDKKKLPEMLEYYAQKGCAVQKWKEIL